MMRIYLRRDIQVYGDPTGTSTLVGAIGVAITSTDYNNAQGKEVK
jgi:hypothetical protein